MKLDYLRVRLREHFVIPQLLKQLAVYKIKEEHLTDDITAEQVAQEVNISPLYFQKGFSILCDISVSEYIRNRRLSLAGRDLRTGDCKVNHGPNMYCKRIQKKRLW